MADDRQPPIEDDRFMRNIREARDAGYDLACADCGCGILDDSDMHDMFCPQNPEPRRKPSDGCAVGREAGREMITTVIRWVRGHVLATALIVSGTLTAIFANLAAAFSNGHDTLENFFGLNAVICSLITLVLGVWLIIENDGI